MPDREDVDDFFGDPTFDDKPERTRPGDYHGCGYPVWDLSDGDRCPNCGRAVRKGGGMERDEVDRLREIADGVAKDIGRDFPDLEVGYDLYVDRLGNEMVGVIDMGDVYQRAFVLVGNEWMEDPRNPVLMRDAIVATRRGR